MKETQILKDITVNVKQGASSFYLKEGTEPIKVIRHKAITADGRLIPEEIDETNIKKLDRTEKNLLEEGDILLSIRHTFKAVVIPKELKGATFTGDFIAITIDKEKISPELLAAYLSQPTVSRYIDAQAYGAIARSFSKESLLNIPLHIPDKQTKDKLKTITKYIEEHRKLIEEEAEKLREIEETLLVTNLGGNP